MDISFMSLSLLEDRVQNQIDADTMVAAVARNGLKKMDMMSHEGNLYGIEELQKAMNRYGVQCDCVISHIPFLQKMIRL